MEDNNNNGIRPEEYPPALPLEDKAQKSNDRKQFLLLCIVIGLVIAGVGGSMGVIHRVNVAEMIHAVNVAEVIDTAILEVETIIATVGAEIEASMETAESAFPSNPNIRRITSVGQISNLTLSPYEVDNLMVRTINGRIMVSAHNHDEIVITSGNGSFNYSFNEDFQGLEITTINSPIYVFVPREMSESIFQNMHLRSVNAPIEISDIMLGGNLSISTTNGNITLQNVFADPDLVSVTTTNGRVIVAD